MRRALSASLVFTVAWPSIAMASPFAIQRTEPAGDPPPVTAQPTGDPPPVAAEPEPAEPSAPAEPAAPAEGPADEPSTSPTDAAPAEGTPTEEVTLSSERQAVSPGAYNAHGLGARGGLTIVPTWILSQFLASHTNSLCRGENIIGFGADRGLTKQQGCNWFVGGEYTYRKSRVFDIVAAVGYQRAKLPDGMWLDKDEWADSCTEHDGEDCDLAAADYTEVDFGFLFLEADFIGRYPIVRTPDVEIGLGGGGGIGLGVVLGKGVHQTSMGPQTTDGANPTCNRLTDLSDFTKCTPGWFDDPDFDQDGDGTKNNDPMISDGDTKGDGTLAQCTPDKCDKADLAALGTRRKQGDVPPVIPVVNLILSMRFIIKDAFAINLQGGFQTGFYFGGSLGYFFGGGGK
jgi:hypothetical protein